MFTVFAVAMATFLAWLAGRLNERERPNYDAAETSWPLILHARQDLKLIAFLLFGIIVMLGIIADAVG